MFFGSVLQQLQKFTEANETTKVRKDDTNIHAELERTAFGNPNLLHLSNPKNGHETNRTI
jgi:hypothetical protein